MKWTVMCFTVLTVLVVMTTLTHTVSGNDCVPTESCRLAGGHCVTRRAECAGFADAWSCSGNGRCFCCIPGPMGRKITKKLDYIIERQGAIGSNITENLDDTLERQGSVEVKIQDLSTELQSHQESVNSTLDYIIKLLKQLSNDLEAVKENITKVAATTQAPTTTSTEAPITGPSNKNTEVNFLTVGGTAKATSTWDDGIYAPLRGFAQPGYTWHSSSSSRLPQSIWYEFPQALRVVKYSFQGRTDPPYAPYPDTAPSSYVFWASNSIECSKIEARVALVVDTSDTPFTNENIPKVVDVENPVYYRCYGFTITETPGRTYVGMSNIRLFYNKD